MRRRTLRWLAVLLLLALLAAVVHADEAETRAIAAVKKLGGAIERDEEAAGKPVIVVDLFEARLTDAGLKDLVAELVPLEKLRELSLQSTQVTDAGLKKLAALKQLRSLDLSGTNVTDAGVRQLRMALPKCSISR